MSKSLFFSLHNHRTVRRLSEIKLMTSLLVSSRNAGNLKLFWFQVQSEFQRKTKVFCVTINGTNNSKFKVTCSTFMFTQDPKLKREWLIEIKWECFTPLKHSHVCAELFTLQNLTVRSLLRLAFTKDAAYTLVFTIHDCTYMYLKVHSIFSQLHVFVADLKTTTHTCHLRLHCIFFEYIVGDT